MPDISRIVTAGFFASNNTTSQTCAAPFEDGAVTVSERTLMTIGYAILFVFSLVGNVLVIVVFYKDYKQLRTPANYFIVNIAVSDLIVPLCVIPRRIKEVYLGFGPWQLGGAVGDLTCRLVEFSDELSVSVSAQTMVFIAAERFWCIVYPKKRPLISRRTTPRFICFTWVFSMIFFSYYFLAYRLVDKEGTPHCKYAIPEVFDEWKDLWRADRLSLLIIFVVIPSILLVIFYTAIIVSLHRQKQLGQSRVSSLRQRQRTKRNQRVTLTLIAIVVVFFISWTPYFVYFFHQYYFFPSKLSCESAKRLYLGTIYMNYFYTAINPLIYYSFNSTYRRGFQNLLSCSCKCSVCGPCSQGNLHQASVLSGVRPTDDHRRFCEMKNLEL